MWLYLSFVGTDDKWQGAAFVQQENNSLLKFPNWPVEGLPATPSKQIAICLIPDSEAPKDHRFHNRLLTRAELEEAMGPCESYGYHKKSLEQKGTKT